MTRAKIIQSENKPTEPYYFAFNILVKTTTRTRVELDTRMNHPIYPDRIETGFEETYSIYLHRVENEEGNYYVIFSECTIPHRGWKKVKDVRTDERKARKVAHDLALKFCEGLDVEDLTPLKKGQLELGLVEK